MKGRAIWKLSDNLVIGLPNVALGIGEHCYDLGRAHILDAFRPRVFAQNLKFFGAIRCDYISHILID